jgi:hypothetical protein
MAKVIDEEPSPTDNNLQSEDVALRALEEKGAPEPGSIDHSVRSPGIARAPSARRHLGGGPPIPLGS